MFGKYFTTPVAMMLAALLLILFYFGETEFTASAESTQACDNSKIADVTTANWEGREGRWLPDEIAHQFVQGIFVEMSGHDWETEKGQYTARSYIQGFTIPLYAHWEFNNTTKEETYTYLLVYDHNLLQFVAPHCARPGYTYLVMYSWRSPEHRSDLGWQIKPTIPWPDEAKEEMPHLIRAALDTQCRV